MARCDRGIQLLLTTLGAFVAFSLMTVAIGTDFWLYSRAHVCNITNITTDETQMQAKKTRGDLTHSGLWRICCIEGKDDEHIAVSKSLFDKSLDNNVAWLYGQWLWHQTLLVSVSS